MKTTLFFVAFVGVLLCPAAFGGPAAAGEDASNQGEPAAPVDEQAELQLLYGERALVTATRHTTSLRKAPAIATVITADEIRNMGARNLLDVLKTVPGFGISINEFGINMIEVRGIRNGANDKILFMIDGHSMQKNIFGSALYMLTSTLPVENIKQVEVVRGPGSALYGHSAFMATVNVITRDADDINGLEIKGSGGSFDTYKGNLVGAFVNDNLAASGSFDYYRTGGPKLVVESDALSGTPWSMTPGHSDLRVRQTAAFLKILYGDFSFRGHYLNSKKGSNIGFGYALTDAELGVIESYWNELAYQLRLSDTLSTQIKISYDYYHQDPYMKLFPSGFLGSFPQGMIGKAIASDGTFGGEIEVDWAPVERNHVIAGASYEDMHQYGVKNMANFDPMTYAHIGSVQEVANWNKNETRQIWAFYLQDEWQMQERLNLTLGVRYDRYSDFGDTLNPRAGLVWNLLDKVDFKLLYGHAFRAPSFQQMYNINNPISVGNPDLQAERVKTGEAGVTYRFSRALNVDINYFHSVIDKLLGREGAGPAHFANIGKWTTRGVELGLGGNAFTVLQWNATYTWQDPRDDITGDRLPYVPSHRVTASLNYALTRYLNLHGDLIWTGSRPRAQGETRPEMPAYTTVDLAVTAWELFKTMEVQLAVHNLFDERYYDPDTSGEANKVPGDFPREGISAIINATYSF